MVARSGRAPIRWGPRCRDFNLLFANSVEKSPSCFEKIRVPLMAAIELDSVEPTCSRLEDVLVFTPLVLGVPLVGQSMS